MYYLYRQNQAVRYGKWFAHRASGGEVELYDLESDPQQTVDLSTELPGIVKEIDKIMHEAHTPSEVWPSPGETPEEFNKRLKDNNIPARCSAKIFLNSAISSGCFPAMLNFSDGSTLMLYKSGGS